MFNSQREDTSKELQFSSSGNSRKFQPKQSHGIPEHDHHHIILSSRPFFYQSMRLVLSSSHCPVWFVLLSLRLKSETELLALHLRCDLLLAVVSLIEIRVKYLTPIPVFESDHDQQHFCLFQRPDRVKCTIKHAERKPIQ